jgi:hypothetical protein
MLLAEGINSAIKIELNWSEHALFEMVISYGVCALLDDHDTQAGHSLIIEKAPSI